MTQNSSQAKEHAPPKTLEELAQRQFEHERALDFLIQVNEKYVAATWLMQKRIEELETAVLGLRVENHRIWETLQQLDRSSGGGA